MRKNQKVRILWDTLKKYDDWLYHYLKNCLTGQNIELKDVECKIIDISGTSYKLEVLGCHELFWFPISCFEPLNASKKKKPRGHPLTSIFK